MYELHHDLHETVLHLCWYLPSACADHGYGKSVLYKKIEMKVNDLIQSFIHRDKSHMISMLNALQQSCF